MDRLLAVLGGALGAIAVAAGAFGAHVLQARLEPRLLDTFETAARYQMYHAIALVAVALAAGRGSRPWLTASGWLFVAGTALFSGALYALALTGVGVFGAVAPVGGACLVAGWACLAVALSRGS